MKSFVLLFALTLTLFCAQIDEFASNMSYYRDYDTALLQAKKENKPIMLVLVGDYCPWCRKFERKTLQRESIARKVQENFIPVIVDRNLDKENYPKLYYSPRIPTVHFIEPNKERKIFESLGYVQIDEYRDTLDTALTKFKRLQ
ncbi:MAG: thioredoxin family protein [Epsilonproteobacteria bacterium]|nr:thioredoxin family protein [Campylobacterota bacterium]OIO13593.1 MAG: hypothetical protein AUJ81_11035 [Helicobacteraceae bacterium CG1_02_36_14]PIP10781.1 MAG: thioredoxin [Sulfurimonas sp. CG23_combo_of_CG06-09_8_20_14_all_36_33]PIS24242.1 MAG: thioredoxin family protein [Sulfurimonas sp. CG08_land_8_20_14_0_20_36_33]PIU36047.1 MAG: thioredoxin family protein [Sulfurimonas sp. CG07_land_8_20_14_0_80_36_56]PIV04392.1 MAG: thioredoxin family protein [Sulfurimonas sp. CG03_land_8_20_14_0_80